MFKLQSRWLSWSLLFFCFPVWASAQDHPSAEIFGGYSYAPRLISNGLHGWDLSFTKNLNRFLGITADVGGLYSNTTSAYFGSTTESRGRTYTLLFGPQLVLRRGRFAPFARMLFGAAKSSSSLDTSGGPLPPASQSSSKWGAAFGPGVGLDIKIKGPWGIRIVQVDGIFIRPRAIIKGTARISFGLTYGIAHKP